MDAAKWTVPAKWDAENDSRFTFPRKVPALAVDSLPRQVKHAQALLQGEDTRAPKIESDPENIGFSAVDGSSRQRASPGALLRAKSSSIRPAPHPLPDLMRLTAPRHVIPMQQVIHSMASLSRAGRENFQRKTNQDSCFAFRQYVQPYQAIAGVLDGHGPNGHIVSGMLKQLIPTKVAEQLRMRGEVAAGHALRASFLEAQDKLRDAAGKINARLSGSTAVVCLLQGRRLTTAWVGDSRAVIVRREPGGGWRGVPLTLDHKPTAAAELSRILAAGGRVERLSDGYGREVGPQRVWLPGSWVPGLAMSRALGDFVAQSVGVTAEPEFMTCELDSTDEYLIVATDGVWEFMTVHEAAQMVGGADTAEDACRELVEAASTRWKENSEGVTDDITVVVTKILPDESTEC